jgi:hypothetical protein
MNTYTYEKRRNAPGIVEDFLAETCLGEIDVIEDFVTESEGGVPVGLDYTTGNIQYSETYYVEITSFYLAACRAKSADGVAILCRLKKPVLIGNMVTDGISDPIADYQFKDAMTAVCSCLGKINYDHFDLPVGQ